MTVASGTSYLLEPNRQAKYKNMMFGGRQKPQQPTVSTSKAQPQNSFDELVAQVGKAVTNASALRSNEESILEKGLKYTIEAGAMYAIGAEIGIARVGIGLWKAGSALVKRGFFGYGGAIGAESTVKYSFKAGEDAVHFEKHGARVANKLDLGSGYNVEQYVQDANQVIHEGIYVPELHAYVKIPTGPGSAQAPFVGLDRVTNEITTFHMKPVTFLEKSAPSLGWQAKSAPEMSDLIGFNRELGWKSPYRGGL